MIYLDYAATTPVDPAAAKEMQKYLSVDGIFANPASNTYAQGLIAANAVEDARGQIATMLNAEPREIVFTSGATESDNLALKGLLHFHKKNGKHIITAMSEHKAILDSCKALEKEGYDITYCRPNNDGSISLDDLKAAIRDDTVLISIMHVNNETGYIQDIDSISRLCKEHGIYFHTDAAQSFGKITIDVQTTPIDLLSISGHKIYGPKGIGALYVRRKPRVRLLEQMSGGQQEHGLRSGTLPTHQIVGFAKAAELMQTNAAKEHARIKQLSDKLVASLKTIEGLSINCAGGSHLANILSITIDDIDNEALIASCPDLAFSAGSACSSSTMAPSHVLQAIGLSGEQANSTIRLSLGRFTTEADIEAAAAQLQQQIQRIRELSPRWNPS